MNDMEKGELRIFDSRELTEERIRWYESIAKELTEVPSYTLGQVADLTGFDAPYIATTLIRRHKVIQPPKVDGNYAFGDLHIIQLKVIKWLKDEMLFDLKDVVVLANDLRVLREVAECVTDKLEVYAKNPEPENYAELLRAYSIFPTLTAVEQSVLRLRAENPDVSLAECAAQLELESERHARDALRSGFSKAARLGATLPLLLTTGLLELAE